MPVGAFPGVSDFNKRTVRQPDNPMDRCTVISIYPRDVDEVKHTIQPGHFFIPAGSYDNPSLLEVGSSSWWKELEENQPLLEIPNSSIQVAEAIVSDYCRGIFECNMADAMPGLFYLPGKVNIIELRTRYKPQLDNAKIKQNNWYTALIRAADALWSRSQGNPLAISDDMRLAARELGADGKEWLEGFQSVAPTRCPACGFMRDAKFPMCSNCKTIIDEKQFKALGLKIAE